MSYDSWSGKPTQWGYKIISRVDDDNLWSEIKSLGIDMKCHYSEYGQSNWYLVTKQLSSNEAETKYGKITKIVTGPRGGYRKALYGKHWFGSIFPQFDWKTDPRVEIEK